VSYCCVIKLVSNLIVPVLSEVRIGLNKSKIARDFRFPPPSE